MSNRLDKGDMAFVIMLIIPVIAGLILFMGFLFMVMWNYAVVKALPGSAGNIGYWHAVVLWLMLVLVGGLFGGGASLAKS